MIQLMSRRHCRHVALLAALAAVGAAMLVGGTASSARAGAFNCETRSEGKKIPCFTISGPNETMEEGEGDNYTYPEFTMVFWKYNGGSSYTEIWGKSFSSYTGTHCYSSAFKGHLQVAVLSQANIAATQRDCVS
jgi:hypothetical protein